MFLKILGIKRKVPITRKRTLLSQRSSIKMSEQYGALPFAATYLLIYAMEQSPSWEANRFAASQEITRILWNPKVHYRIQMFPPHVSILIQLNPVHTHTPYFLKIPLNIIIQSTPGFPQWSLSLRFSPSATRGRAMSWWQRPPYHMDL
jgi:hypothetical protein